MLEYLVVAGVGALLARRAVPSTKCVRGKAYGPKTGVQWDSEYFPELGSLVVMARGTRATFKRTEKGLVFDSGEGDARIVSLMRKDFEG